MRGYMFRNRWLALLFVGLTLASVTKLVGTDKDHGTIQRAAGEIAAQRARAEQLAPAGRSASPAGGLQASPFSGDEDLIDDAAGEDPTPRGDPVASGPDEPGGTAGEITIVPGDEPGQPEAAPPPAGTLPQ